MNSNISLVKLSKLVFLSERIQWFGKYTGYEQLPKFTKKSDVATQIISTQHNILSRTIGKSYSFYRKWSARNSYQTAAELKFSITRLFQPNSIFHILYLEPRLSFLDCWQKAPANLIGTIHLPPSQWDSVMLGNLAKLSSAIILYQRDLEFFEAYVGKNRIHFIHYGVDTDFFHPISLKHQQTKRIFFAGHYLRNTSMLHRVIVELSKNYPELRFDLLVPAHSRNTEGLFQLREHPAVTWHENLSDEELKYLYQTSYLLLLPMSESGANTAIVESLACGLPIVTTDVGGIRDYGGADIFPVVANDDDDATIDLIEKYLSNPDWRNEVAINCRQFAEQKLDWKIVTKHCLKAYKLLSSN
jgi:glycosyltransferase involved in cell wall biosynthesis